MAIDKFGEAWIGFLENLGVVLEASEKAEGLKQFAAFRKQVITLVLDGEFIEELDRSFESLSSTDSKIADALLEELRAFSSSILETKKKRKKKGWLKRWLGRGKAIVGSVDDLLDALPSWAKAGLTLLKELIDIFRA